MIKISCPSMASGFDGQKKHQLLRRICSSSSIDPDLDQLGGLVAYKTLDHQLLHVNQQCLDYTGFKKASDLEGKTDSDLVWSQYAEIYHQHESDALQSIVYGAIQPSIDKDGRFFLFFNNKYPWRNEHGRLLGVFCHAQEITSMAFLKKIYQFSLGDELNLKNPYAAYHPLLDVITNREAEVLFFVVRGKTAQAIGDRLCISKRTVEHHIDNLKAKFACQNKAELVAYALQHGYAGYMPPRFLAVGG